MSNQLYGKGKEKFARAQLNYAADTIKAALVKTAYAPNLASDEFFADISANVLATQVLATKTDTLGVIDAADTTFAAVAAGDTGKAVVLYKDTGNPATSPLIAYIDTITGFPLATAGTDIVIQWDNGAYKIFSF